MFLIWEVFTLRGFFGLLVCVVALDCLFGLFCCFISLVGGYFDDLLLISWLLFFLVGCLFVFVCCLLVVLIVSLIVYLYYWF